MPEDVDNDMYIEEDEKMMTSEEDEVTDQKPEADTESEPTEPAEITNLQYIELKYKSVMEYLADKKEDERNETWYRIRSQINSGLFLGLKQSDIDLYANGTYDYFQMEIIKFVLFSELSEVSGIFDPELTYQEMLLMVKASMKEEAMIGSIEEPLRLISGTVDSYKAELDSYKEMHQREIAEKCEENRLLEQQLLDIKSELDKTRTELQLLQDQKEKKADQEISADIKRRKFSFHKKSRETKKTEAKVENMDLTQYIISSNLSSAQMDIISFAVKTQVDDQLIRQMIEKKLPAAQMKQVLEVALAKEEQKKRQEQSKNKNQTSVDSDHGDPEDEGIYEEEDIYFDGM